MDVYEVGFVIEFNQHVKSIPVCEGNSGGSVIRCLLLVDCVSVIVSVLS